LHGLYTRPVRHLDAPSRKIIWQVLHPFGVTAGIACIGPKGIAEVQGVSP